MTYPEIAKALGVSRSRVQQIERVALAKLRRECERIGLRPEEYLEIWRNGGFQR